MTYPRELNLDPDTEEKLISYLNEEITNHYMERNQWLDDVLRQQKDYWAKPTKEKATFPFTGAATIIIPLTAVAVEAIHARVMTTLFALPQFVTAKAISPEWEDAVQPVERHLDHELKLMGFRDTLDSCLLECEKFGNGIGKVGYTRVVKHAIRVDPITGDEDEFDVVTQQGACFDSVSIGRFLLPFYSQDPQTSPWVGEEQSRTPFEILQLEESGLFRPGTFDKLKTWISTTQTGTTGQERRFEHQQEQLEKTQAMWPKRIDWKEIWLAFNVDGNTEGKKHEIIVHYHQGAQLIMSARYNWYDDLHRPYRLGKYFPIEHRWRAIGIAKQNEQFQREVTTQHRQRLDNATLANMRMFKVHKLSGYGPKEPIFPGKMWFLDDMNHVDSLQLGEIYPSSYNNEQATLIYSQQRTGVNETTLGMPQVGTPGTATSDLARIQEGNKKFDYIYQNVSSFVNELINDVAENVRQFGSRRIEYYNTAEGGQLVKQFYDLPAGFIRDGLIIELSRANQSNNDLITRQNWVQVAQLLQQYYGGLIQLAQATQDAQLIQMIAQRGLTASTEAMKQILESYDIRNVDRIIMKEFSQPSAGASQPNGDTQSTEPLGGGINRPPIPFTEPGMASFSQILGSLGQNPNQGGAGLQLANGSVRPQR